MSSGYMSNAEEAVAAARESHTKGATADETFAILRESILAFPTNVDLQWMYARGCYDVAHEHLALGNKKDAETSLRLGFANVELAIQADPQVAQAHKWYAILLSDLGQFGNTTEQIKNAFVIKEHADKAAALDPNDANTQHMLGVWCYEVSNVGWAKRKAASFVFATPPSSTFAECEGYLLRAKELDPNAMHNLNMLGDCYVAQRKWTDAKTNYQEALDLTPGNEKEKQMLVNINAKLNKC